MPRACSAAIRFSGMPQSAEAAHHDRRAVGDAARRPRRRCEHFVHGELEFYAVRYTAALCQARLRASAAAGFDERRAVDRPRRRCQVVRGGPEHARSARRARGRSRRRWSRRCPSRYRAGLDASRVVSASRRPRAPGPRRRPPSPTTCISALAVSCGRWLRKASRRSCVGRVEHRRGTAPSAAHEPAQLFDDRPARVVSAGVEQPRAALEQIGPRDASRPPRAAPAERMAADERESRRQRRARPRRSRASCCRCR